MNRNSEAIINEIRRVYEDLRRLGVKPEYVDLRRLSNEQLTDEFEAVSDQLKTRKRFLGETN